jgi:prephenate dehydratase
METTPRAYSAFWPLMALMIVLSAQIEYKIYNLWQARTASMENIMQIKPHADAALNARKRLFSLAEELDQLAAKSTAAAQIVAEFKIHGASKEAEPPVSK